MKFSFSNQAEVTTGTMVIMAIAGSKLGSRGIVLDKEMGMALSRAIKTSQFEGKVGQNLSVNFDDIPPCVETEGKCLDFRSTPCGELGDGIGPGILLIYWILGMKQTIVLSYFSRKCTKIRAKYEGF